MYGIIYWESLLGKRLNEIPKMLQDEKGYIIRYSNIEAADAVAETMEQTNHDLEACVISLEPVQE